MVVRFDQRRPLYSKMMEDAELLRRYVEDHSQNAFAELVRRYLALVYSALRRVGGVCYPPDELLLFNLSLVISVFNCIF